MAVAAAGETEVFRITPEVGKCYKSALATRKHYLEEGKRKYFTTNPLEYMGKFIKGVSDGWGDGAHYYEVYDLKGTEKKLDYDYDGNTCLVEEPCQAGGRLKHRRGTKKNKRSRRKTQRRY